VDFNLFTSLFCLPLSALSSRAGLPNVELPKMAFGAMSSVVVPSASAVIPALEAVGGVARKFFDLIK
jgi:hypothetical protein